MGGSTDKSSRRGGRRSAIAIARDCGVCDCTDSDNDAADRWLCSCARVRAVSGDHARRASVFRAQSNCVSPMYTVWGQPGSSVPVRTKWNASEAGTAAEDRDRGPSPVPFQGTNAPARLHWAQSAQQLTEVPAGKAAASVNMGTQHALGCSICGECPEAQPGLHHLPTCEQLHQLGRTMAPAARRHRTLHTALRLAGGWVAMTRLGERVRRAHSSSDPGEGTPPQPPIQDVTLDIGTGQGPALQPLVRPLWY